VVRDPPRYEPSTRNTQTPPSSQYQVYRESEDPVLAGDDSDFDGPAPARHSAIVDPEDLALSDIEEEEECLPTVVKLLGSPELNAEVEAVAEHMDATVLASIEGPDGFAASHESGTANNPVLIPSSPLGEFECLPYSEAEKPETGDQSTVPESYASPDEPSSQPQLTRTPGPNTTAAKRGKNHPQPGITIFPAEIPWVRIGTKLELTIRVENQSISPPNAPADFLSCELVSYRDIGDLHRDPVLQHLKASRATILVNLRDGMNSGNGLNLRKAQPVHKMSCDTRITDFTFNWKINPCGLMSPLLHAAADAAGQQMIKRPVRLEFLLRVKGETGQKDRKVLVWVNTVVWTDPEENLICRGQQIASECGSQRALCKSPASPKVSDSESQLNSATPPISTESMLPRLQTRPKITILPRRRHGGLSARIRSRLKFTIRVENDSICPSGAPAGTLSCQHVTHEDLRPIMDDPILKHISSNGSKAARLFRLRRFRRDQDQDDRNLRIGKQAITTERGVSYTDFEFDWTVGLVGLNLTLLHAAAHAAGHKMVTRAFRLEFRLRVKGEPGQMPVDYPISVNTAVWAPIKQYSVRKGKYLARQRGIFFDVPTDM
jgi:hypothetical protein